MAEGPVMLALSTFRRSEAAVELALERAAGPGRLVVVYVADKNLARYLVGSDIGTYPGLKEKCEEELLEEHERAGRQHVEEIALRARERGIQVTTHVERGRFAVVCLAIAGRQRPSLVVTTRSKRPAWVKRFFGSPVDYLTKHIGCPVEEA
jgi:nucleotide-binding universal stress UspA family protein